MRPEALWSLLADATLAMSLAMLPVLLLRELLRARFGARAAYAAWLAVPCALLALCVPGGLMPAPVALPVGGFVVATAPVVAAPFDPRPLLFAAWGLGAQSFLIALALRHRGDVIGLRLHRDQRDGSWRSAVSDVSPMVLGFWRPRLVLPQDFEQRFDAEEQALVLAHEREHLRAQDVRINTFAALLLAVSWFNPLAWWAWRCFRLDQELACDARVVEHHPRQRRAYARAMLKAQLDPALRPLACAWSDPHPLHRRIAMLTRPSPSPATLRSGRIVVALLALGSGTAIWAQKPAEQASLASIVQATEIATNARGEPVAVMVPALEIQPLVDAAMTQAMAAIDTPQMRAEIQSHAAAAVAEATAVLDSPEVQAAMQVEVSAALELAMNELQRPEVQAAMQVEVSTAVAEAMAEVNSAEVQARIQAEVAMAVTQATEALHSAEVQAQIQAEVATAVREATQAIEAHPAVRATPAAQLSAPAPAAQPAPVAAPAPVDAPAPAAAPAPVDEPAPQSQPAALSEPSLSLLKQIAPQLQLTLRQQYPADPEC
jgi:beta-lactamase regulating signal transducer with metallopeptidase domain